MRRHEKEFYGRMDIQGIQNVRYRAEQVKRTPRDGKYPGTDWRGVPIAWSPADRFRELNLLAWDRRYYRIRYMHAGARDRLQSKLSLFSILDRARAADKPRLP